MKNTAHKIIFSTIGVFFSTLVSATCLPIQGTVQTQSIDGTEQVGQITMTSSSSAFKKAFGQISIMGGVKGIITTINQQTGTIVLDHQIGFPEIGSIISYDDVAQITGPVDTEGNYPVTENLPIDAATYGGAFTGWHGQVVAKGTVNFTTNTNTFIYSGKICNTP
jgi:hypothetical protein